MIFVLNISNNFQNIIIPNTAEIVYLSLPHIYLEWYKIKFPKHPLASRNQKNLRIQEINQYKEQNLIKILVRTIKSIFVTVKMIRSSSDHADLSWVYMN